MGRLKLMNNFIKNTIVRLFGFIPAGISLCPFGIYILNEEYMKEEKLVNHEKIHWRQQVEMLVLPFYIWYIIEWIFKGYRNISFEREAYENDKNLEYLKSRKPYNWIKYIWE